MRVRMKVTIGGFRNGQAWPAIGGEIDVCDREANDLIANGYAETIEEAPHADPAPKRTPRGRGKGSKPAKAAPAAPAVDNDATATEDDAASPAGDAVSTVDAPSS